MAVSFRLRRGTYQDWETRNPRLGQGEIGYEIGTGRYKIGDGVRDWMDLPYFTNEEEIKTYIDGEIDALSGNVSGVTETEFVQHVESESPHPNYDDGADLTLLYLNAKV